MLAAIRGSLEKTNNINRSSYIWNAINAILSAAQCPVILLVMTRTNGVRDAGVFSIAFAVATLMLYLGQYGLRRFQSSDINQKYSFAEYNCMRYITCGAMILASLAYCIYGVFFKSYGMEKFAVVFLICMLKVIQAYADVIHGHMQQRGRLDVATKASSTRYIAEMVSYIVMLIITRDLMVSTFVCIGVSIIVLMLTTINAAHNYCDTLKPSITAYRFRLLAIEGFPLFASLFLNMYITNAPKYAIDAFLTDEIQTYYNLIFMPAFVIQLITHFIFNPIITTYAKLWLDKEKESILKLSSLIRKQCVIIIGLTALALAVALTIGIPVLSFIFGVDLSDYKTELCIIMFGGGMLAYATYFSTVLTVIRMQNILVVCYGVVAATAKIFSGYFVSRYYLMGAAELYAGLMTILAIALAVITIYGVGKEKRALL